MPYKSKADLLDEAEGLGLDVNDDMTRDEILAVLEGAGDVEDTAGDNLGFPHQPGMPPE